MENDDPARALVLVQRALDMLGSSGNTKLQMRAHVRRCWVTALTSAKDVEKLVGAIPKDLFTDRAAAIELRMCSAYAQNELKQGVEAAQQFNRAVEDARTLGESRTLVRALMLRGEMSASRGAVADALADLRLAYEMASRLQLDVESRYVLGAIANLYSDSHVKEYDRAIEYYLLQLQANQKANNAAGISTVLFNLGSTYELKGDLDKAKSYLNQALEMERARGDPGSIASTLHALGVVFGKAGQLNEALATLNEAMVMARKAGDEDMQNAIRLSTGVALRRAGRFAAAAPELDQAHAYYSRQENLRYLERIEDERAQVRAGLGQWNLAYESRSAQLKHQAELEKRQREETASRLRVQFDTEKKDQENKTLKVENELRGQALESASRIRWLQTAVLFLVVIILGVLAAFFVRQARTAAQLRVMALTDELTGLSNRRAVMLTAQGQFANALATQQNLGCLVLDIDLFKKVNDTYGHDVGDVVLRRVSAACVAAKRSQDSLGRTGGEAFTAFLPGSSLAGTLEVAERLRAAVQSLDLRDVDPNLRATISIGVSQLDPHDERLEQLIKRADEALYQSKEAGRNRVSAKLAEPAAERVS